MRDLNTVAIDFETFYTKEYSVRIMSPWAYVFDPRFDAYLLAVHGPGIHWVGNPKDFQWETINGFRWCAHNVGFDGLVVKRLQKDGVVPVGCNPAEWFDTADLAAYLRCKRALQDAARILLGRIVSKDIRSKLKGHNWTTLCAKGWKDQVLHYGGQDAELCYELFERYAREWPDSEQEISRLNREAGWKGIPLHEQRVLEGYNILSDKVLDARRLIPWADTDKPLSPEAIRRQARNDGLIDIPASLAMSSPEAVAWEEKHAEEFPWVRAIRDFRRINMMCERVKTLKEGRREDGTFPFAIKYFGAKTGRTSAGTSDDSEGGRFNMLNPPRKTMFGVNLRSMFVPPEGQVFLIVDYGQIEARLLHWRVGDYIMLNKLKEGFNMYEAAASTYLHMENVRGLKEREPDTYQMVKAMVLGGGYQMGAKRFVASAPLLTNGGFCPDMETATRVIRTYRDANPLVVGHWRRRQNSLTRSAVRREPSYEVELGSGRWLKFYDPVAILVDHPDGNGEKWKQVMATPVRGEPMVHLYGGKVTENEIQGTARDLLCDGWRAVEAAGLHVFVTLYDEYVIGVDKADAQDALIEIPRMLKTSSPWAADCPLDFEAKLADQYQK